MTHPDENTTTEGMDHILFSIYLLDILSGGSLDYDEPRFGDTSRIEAGMRIHRTGGVRHADAIGCYWVRSEEKRKPEYYVSAIKGDVSCECEDSIFRAPYVCKHIVAATATESECIVWADTEMETDAA